MIKWLPLNYKIMGHFNFCAFSHLIIIVCLPSIFFVSFFMNMFYFRNQRRAINVHFLKEYKRISRNEMEYQLFHSPESELLFALNLSICTRDLTITGALRKQGPTWGVKFCFCPKPPHVAIFRMYKTHSLLSFPSKFSFFLHKSLNFLY